MNLKNEYKKWIAFVQLFLILGSGFLLYSKIFDEDFSLVVNRSLSQINVRHILVIAILSLVFWALDTTAWQLTMKPFAQVTFKKALRFNVVAQSAGILTPFLVGDYGLRSLLLKTHINPRQNTLVTLAYQLVKVVTRVAVGIVAAIVLSAEITWGWLLILLAAFILVLGVFSVKQLVKGIGKSKYTKRLLGEGVRLDFTQLNTFKTLLPAVLLFLTFCLQTGLLIYWIDGSVTFSTVLLWVVVTYSVTSFLPPLSFFDPIAKSAFGALMGSQFASADAILVAFTLTWIFNRGLPALVSGLFFKRLSGIHQNTSSST